VGVARFGDRVLFRIAGWGAHCGVMMDAIQSPSQRAEQPRADCYCSRMRSAVTVAVFATLVLAACSGSDESAETSQPAATPPPSTISTTIPAATTSTTTTAPETTTSPTTAPDDPVRLKAAGDAYIASWEAYHAAILDPANPDLRAEVERTHTDPSLDLAISTLDSYAAADYVARPNPDVSAQASLLTDVLLVPGETDLVDVITCEINSEAYYEVGSAPDGGDALIRDEIVVLRQLIRIALVNGDWKMRGGEVLSRRSGDVECLD